MKKIWICLSLVFLLTACKDDKCDDLLCFTPPEPFQFELLDKETNENVFTSGKFDSKTIKVIDVQTNKEIAYTFIAENNYNKLLISTVGWKTEVVQYSVQVASKEIFKMYVDAVRKTEDCCSYTKYNEIRIESVDFEVVEEGIYYKVLID